jgi:GDPmannose 4,6-dehydratase
MKRVLVIGAAGQDGTLLTHLLRARGEVHLGLLRPGTEGPQIRVGDTSDLRFVSDLIRTFLPTQVYYLAAHHHSSQDVDFNKESNLWKDSLDAQVVGLVNVLESIRLHCRDAKLFYASSSHIFGSTNDFPQTELSPRAPDNIYGITKVTGMEACRYYRQEHGLFTSCGILYNHESVYRKEIFLSQKIIRGALAIKTGRSTQLVLGDLSSRVDWGHAADYVEAMIRILDLENPDDYIIATGELHTVREFVETVFGRLGLDYTQWVKENPSIVRPRKGCLVGDAGKLRRATGWAPAQSFPAMVSRLTEETCAQFPELTAHP